MLSQHELQDNHVRFHGWDWKGQPNIERMMQDQRHGCFMYLNQVPDSRSDQYVIFMSDFPLDPVEAQYIYDRWDWQYEEDQGRA